MSNPSRAGNLSRIGYCNCHSNAITEIPGRGGEILAIAYLGIFLCLFLRGRGSDKRIEGLRGTEGSEEEEREEEIGK